MLPVAKTEAVLCRSSPQVYNEREQEKTDYGDDLDARENKFGFAIHSDSENV